jgi:hypothetical protein
MNDALQRYEDELLYKEKQKTNDADIFKKQLENNVAFFEEAERKN